MKNAIYLLSFSLFFITSCQLDDSLRSSQEALDSNFTSSGFGLGYNSSTGNNAGNLGGDVYADYLENEFINTSDEHISTFSIDADGASYSNTRRFILDDQQLPPTGAIRTEEMINYFDLDYPQDENNGHPLSLNGEVSSCPWASGHQLVRIGIKGKDIPQGNEPASNFVFLLDISGSMGSPDKLELLKEGFKLFVDQLTSEDRVAIVVYAGNAGVKLPATSGDQKDVIKAAIDALSSGGGTAGGAGILEAYDIAQENFIEGGNNRIILATDGDFNVGISSSEELIDLIEEKREEGVFLTVIGVGRGNLYDNRMEQIANNGNGTYEYIDNLEQAKKVFIYEINKFYTVAKDVKVQIEFNEQNVAAYRLIGYENRLLNTEDFEDDTKDAGEIGANQNITALYEIIPAANPDRAQPAFEINFRYKLPDLDFSIPMDLEVFDEGNSFSEASEFTQFTGAVASFSMLLYDSKFKGNTSYEQVLSWLEATNLEDKYGFKAELNNKFDHNQCFS